MNHRHLLLFLGLELLAIPWAAVLFQTLESKLLAGALAGGYFVVSGLFMIAKACRWPRRWSSLTWYALIVHVFIVSIPMLATRLWESEKPFSDVRILGLAGPQFHQLSTVVFSVLILVTLIDLARARPSRTKDGGT